MFKYNKRYDDVVLSAARMGWTMNFLHDVCLHAFNIVSGQVGDGETLQSSQELSKEFSRMSLPLFGKRHTYEKFLLANPTLEWLPFPIRPTNCRQSARVTKTNDSQVHFRPRAHPKWINSGCAISSHSLHVTAIHIELYDACKRANKTNVIQNQVDELGLLIQRIESSDERLNNDIGMIGRLESHRNQYRK